MKRLYVLGYGDEVLGSGYGPAVVDDGGHARQEVFIQPPADAEGLGDPEDLCNPVPVGLVDVGSPFPVVMVDAAREVVEKIEVEVVVGVDQAGKGEGTGKVENGPGKRLGRLRAPRGACSGSPRFPRRGNQRYAPVPDSDVTETLAT